MKNTSAPAHLQEPFRQHWQQIEATIHAYLNSGYILNDDIVGKPVLDLECGRGAGAQVFSLLGAKDSFGYDAFLGADVPKQYDNKKVIYVPTDFSQSRELNGEIDFIYLNNATEHIANMGLVFGKAFSALKPGGCLFLAHDNYYQPVGHHDHKFLFLNKSGTAVEPVAPRCYDQAAKCAFSSA
jgi:2-polyprenyl-3-methyl-5-hydroxy-6-metoxy-1,4-benzoquinol methylase